MVKVDLYRDDQGMVIGYKVSGHAGYGEEGADIICSAVSALTQAPVIGLERHLQLKPSCSVNREDGVLEVALGSAPSELTQAVFMTMYYGLDSIARQCPEYLEIREHRR